MYFTPYISVFSPNSGKYRPEITSYGHFSLSDTTTPTPSFILYLRKTVEFSMVKPNLERVFFYISVFVRMFPLYLIVIFMMFVRGLLVGYM